MPQTLDNYNHTLTDLIENPPYGHRDMIHMLSEGRFVIEGKVSNLSDAKYYADKHPSSKAVWDALIELESN